MKRRKFISSGVLAFGGAVIGSGISRRAAAEEISQNLAASGGGYDLLVVSAGISGAFSALKAARAGLKVLVAERGMCPGRELADTFDLSLDPRGFESWDGAFKEIFFPEGEKEEISQKGLFGERGAFVEGGNVAILAGSVEKSFARTLVKNGVDIMFMTDVFGVFADSDSRVCGAALAAKQGTFAVRCASVIDASAGNSLACALAGKEPKPKNAHFSLELFGAGSGCPKNFEIDLGGRKIEAEFLRGRAGGGHGYLRVRVPEGARGFEEASRLHCAEILKNKKALPEALRGAKDFSFARACSYEYSRAENFPKLEGFFVAENLKPVRSCADVSALRASGEGAASLAAARKIGEPQKFFSFCGEIPAPKIGKNVEEFGAKLGLARLEIPEKAASEISCEVLVAGIGTGGVFALDAAAQSGADALGLEYFNDFGGTKSNGGVVGFYWCARGNPIIERSVRDIAAMKALGFSGGSSEAAVCAKKLAGRGAVRGAIICGAQTDGGAFSAAYFCARSRLFRARAKVAVDCTGDADLAAFAKVPFRQGSARSGVPINFSRWNRRNPATIGKPTRLAGGDYGIVDVCSVADFQRAILLSFYESAFFGAYPQLTPRDSRRPEGEKTLDLRAALRGLKGSDIIAQAYTDYDPHSYPTGAFTRCAMLLPHFSHGYAVDIPYGCVVAKNVDGLLLGGRAISATHEAFQFTRMSGDVAVLGEVEGRIAAAAAKLGGHTKGFDVSAIAKRSRGLGYFSPDFGDRSEPSANELVQR